MSEMLTLLKTPLCERIYKEVSALLVGASDKDVRRFLEEVIRRYLSGERDFREIVNASLLQIRIFEKANKIRVDRGIYEKVKQIVESASVEELKWCFVYSYIYNRTSK